MYKIYHHVKIWQKFEQRPLLELLTFNDCIFHIVYVSNVKKIFIILYLFIKRNLVLCRTHLCLPRGRWDRRGTHWEFGISRCKLFCFCFLVLHLWHSSQTRSRFRAEAVGLHHSHCNEGSEQGQPTSHLMATPDP